jgi:hypothetical protein
VELHNFVDLMHILHQFCTRSKIGPTIKRVHELLLDDSSFELALKLQKCGVPTCTFCTNFGTDFVVNGLNNVCYTWFLGLNYGLHCT